jgi:hypothetical protein
MTSKITFALFQETDAQNVADLLNRNRFYLSEHKTITAEEYRYVQYSRGMVFSVLAKKDDKVIGMIAAYTTSGQKVAKPYQIFMGTMLLDVKHRLSFSVLVGLHDVLMKEIITCGYREVLAEVSPRNSQSLFVLLKYGFVLLNETIDIYGYWTLHNYFPAIVRFLNTNHETATTSSFFEHLPVVDKKRAYQKRALIQGRYLESNYQSQGKTVVLLIDILDLKVEGINCYNHLKFYPDLHNDHRFLLENQSKRDVTDVYLKLYQKEDNDVLSATVWEFSLGIQEKKYVEFSEETEKVELLFDGKAYCFFPGRSAVAPDPLSIALDNGAFPLTIDPLTGFVAIAHAQNNEELMKIMWPCATRPYNEGGIIPREKALTIDRRGSMVEMREESQSFCLRRTMDYRPERLEINTYLTRESGNADSAPLSQLWIEGSLRQCVLYSLDEQMFLPESSLLPDASHYEDYVFWDPLSDGWSQFGAQRIRLSFGTATLDVTSDKGASPLVHIPNLVFLLPSDFGNTEEEWHIERLIIDLNLEGNDDA